MRLIQTKLQVENRTQCAIVGADLLGIDTKIVLEEVKNSESFK